MAPRCCPPLPATCNGFLMKKPAGGQFVARHAPRLRFPFLRRAASRSLGRACSVGRAAELPGREPGGAAGVPEVPDGRHHERHAVAHRPVPAHPQLQPRRHPVLRHDAHPVRTPLHPDIGQLVTTGKTGTKQYCFLVTADRHSGAHTPFCSWEDRPVTVEYDSHLHCCPPALAGACAHLRVVAGRPSAAGNQAPQLLCTRTRSIAVSP